VKISEQAVSFGSQAIFELAAGQVKQETVRKGVVMDRVSLSVLCEISGLVREISELVERMGYRSKQHELMEALFINFDVLNHSYLWEDELPDCITVRQKEYTQDGYRYFEAMHRLLFLLVTKVEAYKDRYTWWNQVKIFSMFRIGWHEAGVIIHNISPSVWGSVEHI